MNGYNGTTSASRLGGGVSLFQGRHAASEEPFSAMYMTSVFLHSKHDHYNYRSHGNSFPGEILLNNKLIFLAPTEKLHFYSVNITMPMWQSKTFAMCY